MEESSRQQISQPKKHSERERRIIYEMVARKATVIVWYMIGVTILQVSVERGKASKHLKKNLLWKNEIER